MRGDDSAEVERYAVSMTARIGPKLLKRRLYIAEWRKHRGLTQEQLADRIQSTKASISRYEKDRRGIPRPYMAAIAEALGMAEDDLYRPPGQVSLDSMLSSEPEDVRRQAVEIVEILIRKRK